MRRKLLADIGKLKPNPLWAKLPIFDRSKWQCVRFDDVVENLNETERDPEAHGIERFIGLEHLEPGSLHIREWGNVADGTTFTRRCRPGQVLFGKRRAYQRKVAMAAFDAVVSGDIYVLAPKNDRLLPELLPFLCMSERFFQFAVETSAGSLSPRTNWKQLAQFEFALPPLDQQRRIAEILWAVDEVLEGCVNLRNATEQIQSSYAKSLWGNKHLERVMLADLCIKVQDGTHFSPKSTTGPFRYLTSKNIRNGYLDLTECGYISAEEHEGIYRRADVKKGDVVLTKDGANTGNCTLFDLDEKVSLLSSVAFIRTNSDKLDAGYLTAYLRSEFGWSQIRRQMKGTAITRITLEQIRKIPIPVLKVAEQCATSERMAAFEALKNSISNESDALRSLLRSVFAKVT